MSTANQNEGESLFQVCGRLALELACPACAEVQLSQGQLRENEAKMSAILTGQAFRVGAEWGKDTHCPVAASRGEVCQAWRQFVAGSRAEGLALENRWGHRRADRDNMSLYGGPWGFTVIPCNRQEDVISVPEQHRPRRHLKRRRKLSEAEQGRLLLQTDYCRAGHGRLNVLGDKDDLAGRMGKTESYGVLRGHIGKDRACRCLVERDGLTWLSSHQVLRALVGLPEEEDDRVHGPAGKLGNDLIDVVPCLVGSHPLPDVSGFMERVAAKAWPTHHTQRRISQLPAAFVPVGHTFSPDADLEWRHSWSLAEVLLAKDMPTWVKQAFWGFKYTFKKSLERERSCLERGCRPCCRAKSWRPRGRTQLGSYHLKTVLLWELEDPDCWQETCPFRLMLRLLDRLQQYLCSGCLPHYFTVDADLFEGMQREEITLAQACVHNILADPIAAVIASPHQPWLLYGGRKHEQDATVQNVIEALRKMSSSHQLEEDVVELLSDIDLRRQKMYTKLRAKDRSNNIHRRRKLDKLAELLYDGIVCDTYL